MIPVFPYQIRKSEDGCSGELLLGLQDRKKAFVLTLSLDQARLLAVEMRGLATDHCTQHHLALAIADALGAQIACVILKGLDRGLAIGVMRVQTGTGLHDVEGVDVAAALALAMHKGLPVFMDREHLPTEAGLPVDSPHGPPIPEAFQDVIEGLDWPFNGDE